MGAYLNASNESRHAGANVRHAGADPLRVQKSVVASAARQSISVIREDGLPRCARNDGKAAFAMTFVNRLFHDFLERQDQLM